MMAPDDDFLKALEESCRDEGQDASLDDLVLVGRSAMPIAPRAALRERLLREAAQPGRLNDFAALVAQELDLSEERASELLNSLDDPSVWKSPGFPATEFCWVEGGGRVENAVRGFVRVEAGADFPEHEHVGRERVLVIQGGLIDSVTGEWSGAGALLKRSAGSSHGFHVPEGGPALLILSVIHEGVRLGGTLMTPQ